jgi:YidC/Oxa1 family membrane protein insertase
MDRIRFALWFGLLAAVWISYTTWVRENQSEPLIADESPTAVQPALNADEPGLPEIGPPSVNGNAAPPATAISTAPKRPLRVQTDVLDLIIDLDGGDIVQAILPGYPVDKKNPDDPVRLLNYEPETRWVFETGIISPGEGPEPNHQQAFRANQDSYRLVGDNDTLEVRLQWADRGSVRAEKVYTFRRGEFAIDLDLIVYNETSATWQGAVYTQMSRVNNPVTRQYLHVDTYSFKGPVLYNGDEYQKLNFDDLQSSPLTETGVGGWLASIQHHFLAAVVPPDDESMRLDAQDIGMSYRLRAVGPVKDIAAGTQLTYPVKLFVGPKLQDQLRAVSPELDLTVDYGKLTFLSHPLFLLLNFIHGWVKNWGLAIVLCTLLIKAVFYKLTATSGRSMAKMRKLAPRMKALQEKHKDDRPALSQAMMDLYKKEKVNPAAGCLPMLIQMPFFFAFYWVLVETAEMRQAPFALWINDLSVRDPFFVLPLLMGAAMLFQMRLNPAPPDPVQAKVMQIMPIAFTAMFAFFPAGLVLYWLTNTVVSIAQQWRINQLVARES